MTPGLLIFSARRALLAQKFASATLARAQLKTRKTRPIEIKAVFFERA